MFSPLTKEEVRKITLLQIERIEQTLSRSGRSLTVTPEALEQLVTDGYSLAYGARFLKRVIESKIKLPISQRWTEGKSFIADVNEGQVEIQGSGARGQLPGLAGPGEGVSRMCGASRSAGP